MAVFACDTRGLCCSNFHKLLCRGCCVSTPLLGVSRAEKEKEANRNHGITEPSMKAYFHSRPDPYMYIVIHVHVQPSQQQGAVKKFFYGLRLPGLRTRLDYKYKRHIGSIKKEREKKKEKKRYYMFFYGSLGPGLQTKLQVQKAGIGSIKREGGKKRKRGTILYDYGTRHIHDTGLPCIDLSARSRISTASIQAVKTAQPRFHRYAVATILLKDFLYLGYLTFAGKF